MDLTLLQTVMFYLFGAGAALALWLGSELTLRGSQTVRRALSLAPFGLGLVSALVVSVATPGLYLAYEILTGIHDLSKPFFSLSDEIGHFLRCKLNAVLLVLGCVALVRPCLSRSAVLPLRDSLALALASGLAAVAAWHPPWTPGIAIALTMALAFYIYWSARRQRMPRQAADASEVAQADNEAALRAPRSLVVGLPMLLAGPLILIAGAIVVSTVGHGTQILNADAVGWALPSTIGYLIGQQQLPLAQLAIPLGAAVYRQWRLALGAIVAIAAFNIGTLLALVAMWPAFEPLHGLAVETFVMLAGSLAAAAYLHGGARLGSMKGRLLGAGLVVAYLAYVSYVGYAQMTAMRSLT